MKQLFFLFILLLLQNLLSGQVNSVRKLSISFEHEGTIIGGKRFVIQILPETRKYKVIYLMRDSINNNDLSKNRKYKRLLKEYDKSSFEKQKKLIIPIFELYENYSCYTHDFLYIEQQENPDLYKTLKSIINQDNKRAICKNIKATLNLDDNFFQEMIKKDERIILINRIHFKVALQNKSQSTTYYISTPTQYSYPIFYNLIESLLQEYRLKKPNSFLKKENTFYY
jgi:hypothetical protein